VREKIKNASLASSGTFGGKEIMSVCVCYLGLNNYHHFDGIVCHWKQSLPDIVSSFLISKDSDTCATCRSMV